MFNLVQHDNQQSIHCYPLYKPTPLKNNLYLKQTFVSIHEIKYLRQLMAKAALGEYFLIQIGGCSDALCSHDEGATCATVDFTHQLAEFFQQKTGTRVIQIGHMSGACAITKNQASIDFWNMRLNTSDVASPYSDIKGWPSSFDFGQKIYTVHELTRVLSKPSRTVCDETTGLKYNRSTHVLWLGRHSMASREHLSYLKKIVNPIALKIDSQTPIKLVLDIIDALDADFLPGRIILIPRLGARWVELLLPQLIEAVNKTNHTVLWSCDPMHGNTKTLPSGLKSRKLSTIVEEIQNSFLIHKKMGTKLNAIHLEATHHDVMECMDYPSSSSVSVFGFKKKAKCSINLRLNYEQTMHVMRHVAKHYVAHHALI